MKRIALIVATLATALGGTAVAYAATTLVNPASKTKLAYAKKTLKATKGKVTLTMPNPSRASAQHRAAQGCRREGSRDRQGQDRAQGQGVEGDSDAQGRQVPLLLLRAWPRGGRYVGDPHGQVIGAAGPVAALAALVVVATAPTPTVDRVDEQAAWSRLVRQVQLGPRPAGSNASKKLAQQLKAELPRGSFQAVPGGLRNVVGFVPGPRSFTHGCRRGALRHEGPARLRRRQRRRGRHGARRGARAHHRAERASPHGRLHPLRRRGVA